MKSGKIYRIAAFLLALTVMFALASLSAFASGEDSAPDAGSTLTTGTTGTTGSEGSSDDTATSDGDTGSTTGSDEDGSGEDATGATEETTAEATTETEAKEINWDLIITLSVIGLLIIVFFIFFFANPGFRAKVKKLCKDLSSELKKVVWSPWRDVKKNTVIVIVVSLGAALLIFILDMLFSKGLAALTTLVRS